MTPRTQPTDSDATATTRARYDAIAPVYNLFEWTMELLYRRWRRRLWLQVEGPRVLEIGVGTGKNLPFHPKELDVTAIDISPRMLARAKKLASQDRYPTHLALGDAQQLRFEDGAFDAVVTTFVMCSIPDVPRALEEIRRVLRPGGRLYTLDHVLSAKPVLARVMRALDWLPFRVWGAHIDRETTRAVEQSSLDVVEVSVLLGDVFQLLVAEAPSDVANE